MSEQKGSKINRLQHILPEGLLVTAAWLEAKGYSSPLRSKYVSANWLEMPARSIYRRPSDRKVQWQHVVISLQHLLKLPFFVGGRTALELHGFAHYLPMGEVQEIHLYGDDPVPGWLKKLELETRFVFHKTESLFGKAHSLSAVDFNLKDGTKVSRDTIHGSFSVLDSGHWDWPMTISSPERAVLELLDEVPTKETFHQADVLMEGLRTLSPNRLNKLLADCKSIKVKRLFLWFAERHNFRWFKSIDQSKINLGSGKRMIAKGGKYVPKYKITVPEDLYGDR